MQITESLTIEHDRRGHQEGLCSDCDVYRLMKHGLTRSDYYFSNNEYRYSMGGINGF